MRSLLGILTAVLLVSASGAARASMTAGFPFLAPQRPDSSGATTFTLTWTAPGDDGMVGTASFYLLTVNDSTYQLSLAPQPAGSSESVPWQIGVPSTFSMRAGDDAGNIAPPGNTLTLSPGSGTDSYLAFWQDAYSGDVVMKTCWSSEAGFPDERVPAEPGEPDTCWCVFTESVPQMGFLEVVRVNGSGTWTGPVYAGHMATFVRSDTTLFWTNDASPPGIRLVTASQFPGKAWWWTGVDKLGWMNARVWTQSQVQWEWRFRLIEIFGYYVMAGERVFTP